MKTVSSYALGLVAVANAFGGPIDVSTGVAAWQVYTDTTGNISAIAQTPNSVWAPAPLGSSWVSWGVDQSLSCVVFQTPGQGCASALVNPTGDVSVYQLVVTAAQLNGATSGSVNFVFGSDNRANLFVGNEYNENSGGFGPTATGYDPLSCSAPGGSTNAGNTQFSYANCTTAVPFSSGDLGSDGSLTIVAYVLNLPIANCPACGDPTGFVLGGTLTPDTASATPEPATIGLVGIALSFVLLLRHIFGDVYREQQARETGS